MNSEIQISELEDIISEKIYIKIENWNLYLGDAGLSRGLAIECIGNINKGSFAAAKLSLNSMQVNVGNGNKKISLSTMVPESQIVELEEILEKFFEN